MFRKPTYDVQGHTFTLKVTSPRNRKIVNEILEYENVPADDEAAVQDEYRLYLDLFIAITDGPHDKLDFEDFDVKASEAALADFFPSAVATAMKRSGYLL